MRQRGKKEKTNNAFSFPHCPPSLVPFALYLPIRCHFFRLMKTPWQPKFARWNTLPRALSRKCPTKQPETRPLEFKSLLSFILRVLLDRYAACRSSKDVVEVQHAWLQECQKEKVERLTQGICLLDNSVVFSLSFKMHARGEAPRRKSHHFRLCFRLHCTKMNNFCHSEICAESVLLARFAGPACAFVIYVHFLSLKHDVWNSKIWNPVKDVSTPRLFYTFLSKFLTRSWQFWFRDTISHLRFGTA